MTADTLCPFCGANSTQRCELEEEMPGCSCPWEDQLADERQRKEEPSRLILGKIVRIPVRIGFASPSASFALAKGQNALVSGSREDGADG